MAINIIIADDDAIIRESLKIILGGSDEINVKGIASNGEEAIEICLKDEIDVALVDIRMPIKNGVEAIREITLKTNTKSLVLTTFDEEDYIKKAMSYGAKGYILKNTTPNEIINSIKLVYSGKTVMQDEVMDKYKISISEKPTFDKSKFTQRELEIMEAVAEGLSNREVGNKLFISEGTVKNYITSILLKTNLGHRTQIAILWIKGNI